MKWRYRHPDLGIREFSTAPIPLSRWSLEAIRKWLWRHIIPGVVNRTFENRTQSNSIRGLSSIKVGNRTKSNTTHSVSSISKQIEFNWTNRTQSNTIKWISFDCLWRWIYTKKALSKPVKASFSRAFFTIYSITQTPFINCPRQLREQNRTIFQRAYFEIAVAHRPY